MVTTNSVGGGEAGIVMSYIPSYESFTGTTLAVTTSVGMYVCQKRPLARFMAYAGIFNVSPSQEVIVV